jgi:hypothetical protein
MNATYKTWLSDHDVKDCNTFLRAFLLINRWFANHNGNVRVWACFCLRVSDSNYRRVTKQ